MLPSLQRAVSAQHVVRSTIRALSSSSPSSSFPDIGHNSKTASPAQIAQAKAIITSSSNPRSRRYNNAETRTFPSFIGISTKPKNERESTENPNTGRTLYPSKHRYDTGVLPEDMPYLHHFGHDQKPKPKFKNPRKRASKLFAQLMAEEIEKSKASKPEVWGVPFKVGDAIELEVLDDGGVDNPNNRPLDKIRGVVLGRHNRGLDTGIYLKDVLYGEHVERKVKLHSPMVKTLKVLEEGFVNNRGKKRGKRIKRAKLYYLRDRKPEETRVSALQK